jgi:hypothetical protein
MTPNPYIAGFVDGFAVGFVRARLELARRGVDCAACGHAIHPSSMDRLLCARCRDLTDGAARRESEAARQRALADGSMPMPGVLDGYGLSRLQEVYSAKRRLPR